MFIPAAGYYSCSNIWTVGNGCNFWSSSLYTCSPEYAWYVYGDSDYIKIACTGRWYGFSVRPVLY
jgi:hypothetical protein